MQLQNTKWHVHHKRVHYQETDQMGVVHHANYISWFEIGRTEAMRAAGIRYKDMEQLGLLLPVLDVEVKYHHPACYDDLVAIYTNLSYYTPVRMEFTYEIRNHNDFNKTEHKQMQPVGKILASGKTVHMWVNQEWKPARLDRIAPDIYKWLARR